MRESEAKIAVLSMLPETELLVAGDSMEPAVPRGARLVFAPAGPESLRLGEIVCFRSEGEALAHRLVALRRTPEGFRFLCKGDNRLLPDPEFGSEALLGCVTAVNGRLLHPSPWTARVSRWQGAFQSAVHRHAWSRGLGGLKVRFLGRRSLLLGLVKFLSHRA